jgi:hypothetical protein
MDRRRHVAAGTLPRFAQEPPVFTPFLQKRF